MKYFKIWYGFSTYAEKVEFIAIPNERSRKELIGYISNQMYEYMSNFVPRYSTQEEAEFFYSRGVMDFCGIDYSLWAANEGISLEREV